MKIKNICGREINVEGKKFPKDAEMEVKKKTTEIKNLIKQKYVEEIK